MKISGSSSIDNKATELAKDEPKPVDKDVSRLDSPKLASADNEPAPRSTSTATLETREELGRQRDAGVEGSFRRAQLEAAVETDADDVDLLAGASGGTDTEASVSLEELQAPVTQANGTATEFRRVDAYARRLAEEAPDPTYHQGDYVEGMADALSGRVEGLDNLTDSERTRLLDHAHEQFYLGSERSGNSYVTMLQHRSDAPTQEFIADDLARRAMVHSDRARGSVGNAEVAPVHRDQAVGRAQFYATQAGLANAAEPQAFLERLGPDAGRFADALNVDRPGLRQSEATTVVARRYYEAAETASPSVRDAFQTTMESRATGQPENPIVAEQWQRLSTLDPSSFGQADLRYANDLLNEHPPSNRGADILGADHPAVVASAALQERRGPIADRLQQENAVYARAGFSDDTASPADSVEARSEYLSGVADRVGTLSPRAADQALEAIRLQEEAGATVPNSAELQQQLGRRLMISSGQDLAARIDHQMDTALADRGIVGETWDGARNLFGADSGSEAVDGHLQELRAARDDLVALESFEGSDAELSAELATRLDRLQGVAQTTSEAVGGFIESQDSLSTRGIGLLQAVGGGLEVAGGAAMVVAPEPLTSVAGVGVVAIGADDVQAGVRKVVSGDNVPTFRAQLAEQAALAAGASEGTAQGIGMVADLAPAGVSLARGVYRQAHRVFAAGRGAGQLADAAPLTDNFVDFMARPRTATNAVRGQGFHGPAARQAVEELEAQGIRVVQGADGALDDMVGAGAGRGPLGGFNHETGELMLRGNPTYYEFFHEATHARQWLEMGKDGYQAQSTLQREAHVFNQIMANGGRFNRPELRHAENYIQRLADKEAHALMASGRYHSKREVLEVLGGQGVPESVLQRIPVEIFGNRPRRGIN